jgi:hypothetical protein
LWFDISQLPLDREALGFNDKASFLRGHMRWRKFISLLGGSQ